MLKLNSVSKTFAPGTVNEKKALDSVTLHLEKGDFVTVLGSNGAGKSTLFNAIAGTFVPDGGTIELDGKNITNLPDYKRSKYIGRLFQDPLKGTAPNMTIEENLALAYMRASSHTSPFSMVSRADRREFRERLAQLDLGLEDRMEQNVGLLSGGQRQALTLLMATLVTPKLLLLDDPTVLRSGHACRRRSRDTSYAPSSRCPVSVSAHVATGYLHRSLSLSAAGPRYRPRAIPIHCRRRSWPHRSSVF